MPLSREDCLETFGRLRQYLPICPCQPRRLLSILGLLGTLLFFYFVFGSDDRVEFDMRPAEIAVEIKVIEESPIWPLQLQDESIRDRSSSYSLVEPLASSLVPVTAVIYRVSDEDEGIQQIVSHLSKYPFIKEILIFNQVESRPLAVEDFGGELSENISIEIYSSSDDIQTMGRFTTCSMASHETCYTQDDVWLNVYLDSLYTLSLKSPDLVYANARPTEYIDTLGWRFRNTESLHTGYADLRYGAFIPRHKAQAFLTQLAEQGITTAKLRQADMYFSLWTNQYPWVLSNSLVPLDQEANLKPILRSQMLHENMCDALNRLEQSLVENSTQKDHFSRIEQVPLESRLERASCVNDKCLFITNIDPFPAPGTFVPANVVGFGSFQARKTTNVHHEWIYRSYQKAVDQDPRTCWNTIKAPLANEYFGLTMVVPMQAKRLVLYGRTDIRHAATMFNVTVESVDDEWVTCRVWTLPDAQTVRQRVALGIECPEASLFKTLRVHFVQDQQESFDVCGIGLDNFVV